VAGGGWIVQGRFRAKRKRPGLVPESQGQNLAVTVLHVPYWLDSEQITDNMFSSSLLLSGLELNDTKVNEPSIRARLGTASQFCEVAVVNMRTVPNGTTLLTESGVKLYRTDVPRQQVMEGLVTWPSKASRMRAREASRSTRRFSCRGTNTPVKARNKPVNCPKSQSRPEISQSINKISQSRPALTGLCVPIRRRRPLVCGRARPPNPHAASPATRLTSLYYTIYALS